MTSTEICNMALRRIGSSTIAGDYATENSVVAKVCRTYYENNYDETLRMHPWRCALHRLALAVDATPPAFEWSLRYKLPADPWCLRALRLEYKDQQFEVEGRWLLANVTGAKLQYVKRALTGELDPLCTGVIAMRLAIAIAPFLAGDRGHDVAKALEDTLTRKLLPEARHANATEGLIPDFRKQNSTWETARRLSRIDGYR